MLTILKTMAQNNPRLVLRYWSFVRFKLLNMVDRNRNKIKIAFGNNFEENLFMQLQNFQRNSSKCFRLIREKTQSKWCCFALGKTRVHISE